MKPIHEIEARLGIGEGGKIQKFCIDTVANHMDKYIPYSGDSGNIHLRENIKKTADSITYKQPYAHAQYIGYTKGPVRHYTTPRHGSILG